MFLMWTQRLALLAEIGGQGPAIVDQTAKNRPPISSNSPFSNRAEGAIGRDTEFQPDQNQNVFLQPGDRTTGLPVFHDLSFDPELRPPDRTARYVESSGHRWGAAPSN